MTDIALVTNESGNYAGIYLNGHIVVQGENLTLEEVIRELLPLTARPSRLSLLVAEDESMLGADSWTDKGGHLPEELEDVEITGSPRAYEFDLSSADECN